MLEFLGFAAATAVLWGAGDFLNARASRRTHPLNAWVFSFGIAAFAWMAFGMLTGNIHPLSAPQLALALGAALGFSIGDYLYVSAARRGKIAQASPLLSLNSVVAVGLGILVLAEAPASHSLFFAMIALAGGTLIGLRDLGRLDFEKIVPRMLPAIIAHGIGITLFKLLVTEVGVVPAAVWFQSMTLAYLLPVAWLKRKQLVRPIIENAGAAAAYFSGFFAFAIALSSGLVSLVAPVANLFPLVAVGLAVAVYGETLQRHQWAGLALAAAGLAGLAA